MAYRGRGRGRGGFSGGGGFGFAKQEPFVLFPDIDMPIPKGISDVQQKTDAVIEEENLINQTRKFQKIWKDSPYYLEQNTSNERQNEDVERYSDRTKPKTTIRRGSLFSILELKGFPQELTGGSRVQQPGRKRVRWNPNSELEKLDLFEKLEQRQGQNDTKEKKEGEGEDEDENEEEEEQEEEDFSDDDYYKDHVWENKMFLIKLWSCRALMLMMMKMIIIWKMMVTVGTIHLIHCNFYHTIAWNN
ncbi:hypothetical protein DVH24_042678 [Malus domestica]|uniref:DNA-directed RNA polymerase III subunit n=1 Tax=Malus domestica TaxID=3750 RepID=A0A498I367_MALDO|nr:hypothetical protein DVH24_042678 [Malus domestica]